MLESVIVATIMLSAIAFVATFESAPTSTSAATRTLLQQRAQDALSILYDSPATDTDLGDNLLSQYLVECLQGSCTDLTSKLNRTLPIGSSYAIYLSNGVDTYPVYVTKEPQGEAVTAKRLVEPRWSYTFTGPSMVTVNNVTDPLVITSIPVFNSNVLTPGGSPLKVIVRGVKHSDGSQYTLEAEYATEAYDGSQVGLVPAVSLNFLVNRTYNERLQGSVPLTSYQPGAYWDRYAETVYQAGVPACACEGSPSEANLLYRLRIDDTSTKEVAAGTLLTINVPRGWSATGDATSDWQILQDATDWNSTYTSSDVVARRLTPISGSVEFTFHAKYHGDLLNDYPFHAYLSNGADAEANLLVHADGWPSQTQTFALPSVIASVPRPMGATEETTWAIAVNIPYNPVANIVVSKTGVGGFVPEAPTVAAQPRPGDPQQCVPGAVDIFGPGSATFAGCTYGDTTVSHDDAVATNTAIVIKNITIINEDGADIFDTVTPNALIDEGTWTPHGSSLFWEADGVGTSLGGHYTTTQGPVNLTFTVKAKGNAGSTNPHQSVVPPAQYETVKSRLTHQLSPGLYRESFLPDHTTGPHYPVALKGYATGITNVQTPLNHTYTSDSIYRATALAGSNHYTDNALSPYHDNLYGSYVNVDKRTVAVGGQVVLTADVQSILYALAQAGQSAGVNLTFYPPWTGDDHVPIWRQENLDSGLTAADVSKLVMLDVTDDGIPDPVVATSTGRVLAYDAATGERTQGNTFIAPVSTTHGSGSAAAVTALETIDLGTADYIVVGTDAQSDIYVLDHDLDTVWTYEKPAQSVVAMDTRVDLTGDGRNDIAVTLADSTTYVLEADDGDPTLHALHVPGWVSPQSEALYQGTGTPSTIVALDHMGRDVPPLPGFATSLVQKPGAGATVNSNSANPLGTVNLGLSAKVPAAGLELVDSHGDLSSTFWGPAVTVGRAIDHDHDGLTDIVAGSSSGYVYMLNGERAANPVQGILLSPSQRIVDGDVRDNAHAAMLMDDGGVYYTFDGWNIAQCMNCDPVQFYSNVNPGLNSISMAGAGDIWGVGDGGLIYKTTNLPDGTPEMVPVTLANVLAGGIPMDPTLAVHDYKSTQFLWGTDDGWIVGSPVTGVCGLPSPLDALCNEGAVLRTTDGGASWTTLTHSDTPHTLESSSGGVVTDTLLRVNFTTPKYGWIAGTHGTLLRSTDFGATFHGVDLHTTADIRDVSCAPEAPQVCIAVGADTTCDLSNPPSCIVSGKRSLVLMSTDAINDNDGSSWHDISALVDDTLTRDMNATAMYSATHALVAGGNQVWETRDGGLHWTALPMGGKLGPVDRLAINPDETGFGFGGNVSGEGYIYYFGDYHRTSTARTTDVSGGLPADAVIDSITVDAAITNAQTTHVTVRTSNDDGATWYDTSVVGTETPQPVADATGVSVVLPKSSYRTDYTGLPAGHVPIARFDFDTDAATAESTGRVLSLSVSLTYHCTGGSCVGTQSPVYDIGVHDPAYVDTDPTHTTATWDTDMGQIRNPIAVKFWTTNVSGYVQDVQVGSDVTGDGEDDVWVATGSILAENNPDYLAFTGGDVNAVVSEDDRVYLLDGVDGHVVARSDRLDGNVTMLQLVDLDGGGPDQVYVATKHTLAGVTAGSVYSLHADDLTPVATSGDASSDTVYRNALPPVTGLGGATVDHEPLMYFGTVASGSTGKAQLSGALYTLRTSDLDYQTRRPDVRGTYVVAKDIPSDWLFGPYVVEVAVDWTDNVMDHSQGTPVARSILQSARFYDYFVVAPPSSLAPPSPVYDVHLVTWMDDWR